MNTMTIELVKGQKQEFTFLGWKDDGWSFYAIEAGGGPAVITPNTAYPAVFATGLPPRFPKVVPSEIVPYEFRIAWTARHRQVLCRWRDAKQAEVEAYSLKALFPFDALKALQPVRTPEEVESARKQNRQRIEEHYNVLTETCLMELLDSVLYPNVLDEFRSGKWADEMGNDFKTMLCSASEFEAAWHDAYDAPPEYSRLAGMSEDLDAVGWVMRVHSGEVFHLRSFEVRLPTDREAEAYALMVQLVGGESAPHRRLNELGAAQVLQFAKDVVEIKGGLKGLVDKERGRKKVWRAKGGAATLKLGQCMREARTLKNYIRRRAASLGKRGLTRAIREGRQWFKTKYPDLSSIVEGMHDNSLRNFVTGQTGRRPKGNSKR